MSAIPLPRTTEGPLTAESVRQNHSEAGCDALLGDFAPQAEKGTGSALLRESGLPRCCHCYCVKRTRSCLGDPKKEEDPGMGSAHEGGMFQSQNGALSLLMNCCKKFRAHFSPTPLEKLPTKEKWRVSGDRVYDGLRLWLCPGTGNIFCVFKQKDICTFLF